jgi:hypothetical protein
MDARTLTLCAVLTAAAPALALEVAGVKLPDTTTVEGKSLTLNGAGIRKKFIIKVYVGGLYVEAPAHGMDPIVSGNQAWSVHMHFLRNVEKDKIVGAFREGFANNSASRMGQLTAGLDKISAALRDLRTGDELVVSYAPGRGTTVGIAGTATVSIEGKVFADALLANWLGAVPADAGLKAAMLGGK